MPSEIAPATVAEVLGTDPATPPPAPLPERSAASPVAPIDADAKGVPFDPVRHLAIKHPKTGCWMPRRAPKAGPATAAAGGPPPPRAAASVATGAAGDAPPPTGPAPDLSDIERAAAGTPAAGPVAGPGDNATVETAIGLIQILLVLAGDEEGVLSPAEKLLLRPSLLRIMTKYEIGADVLPAEVELLFALAGIVIERVKRGGKTATTFAKMKAWLAGVLFKARGAQIGAQMRREVPADLVAGLRSQVDRLQAELAAAKAGTAGGVV